MRILFITRTHPHRDLGALETRLHDRLRELSELGHDVLVLTRWSGEAIDFELPKRIEVRFPFKSFRPWEWTRALPMIFSWRPDLLHVFDPGLSTLERAISVELMAITMLDTLRKASRGRSTYRGGLVSLALDRSSSSTDFEALESGWKRAGAEAIEYEWLGTRSPERFIQPWDFAPSRRLRLALAGRIGEDIPFSLLLDALSSLRTHEDLELTVLLNRVSLSPRDRRELARVERLEAFGAAIGSRLHLVSHEDEFAQTRFDAGLIIGMNRAAAETWIECLPVPLVLSEGIACQTVQALENRVTEVAPFPRALQLATDREALAEIWSQIEQGSLTASRDMAANHVSRIYSQIAGSRLNS